MALPARPAQKWTVTLNGFASYPLIAAGRVFVATGNPASYGGSLYALDATTGKVAWGPVPITATYFYISLAYGGGRVFVNEFDGTVLAFSASTGKQLWAQTTAGFSGEPVYYNGAVYVQSGASVWALSASSGRVLWTSAYLDGDGSAVSANGTGVYVAAGCSWFRLALATGSVIWSGNSGCTGGGGGTTYLADGLDFETVGSLIVNAASGKTVGTFAGTPAFAGSAGFFATGSQLAGENVQTRKPIFTTTLPAAIVTSPVVAGKNVYVGTASGRVYGLSTSTGKVAWSHRLPAVPGGGGQYTDPSSDIGVGQGLLIVPANDQVTAFG